MSSLRDHYDQILKTFPPGATPVSGWGDYIDTTYTQASPQLILANIDTILMNNSGTGVRAQEPEGVVFVENGKIKGRFGESIAMSIEFNIVPTDASTTLCEVWFNIGGAIGQLYRRPFTFPKGQGVERKITFTQLGYTYDTWQANGATVYVRTNGNASIYGTRFLINRGHLPYNL